MVRANILQSLQNGSAPKDLRLLAARGLVLLPPHEMLDLLAQLSENEVEAFAAMRSVSDEILREIGNSREWTRNYGVVHNLVKNPKTPPLISQHMLFRLQARDLMLLVRDSSIPEALRRNAQRTLSQRSTLGSTP